jgi:hypothetical protein
LALALHLSIETFLVDLVLALGAIIGMFLLETLLIADRALLGFLLLCSSSDLFFCDIVHEILVDSKQPGRHMVGVDLFAKPRIQTRIAIVVAVFDFDVTKPFGDLAVLNKKKNQMKKQL